MFLYAPNILGTYKYTLEKWLDCNEVGNNILFGPNNVCHFLNMLDLK